MARRENSPAPLDYARPLRFGDGPIARLQDWFSIPLVLAAATQSLICSQKLGVGSMLGIADNDGAIGAIVLALIISAMMGPVIDSRFGYRVFPETTAKVRAILLGVFCPTSPLLVFSVLWLHPIEISVEVRCFALGMYMIAYPLLAARWILPNNRIKRN